MSNIEEKVYDTLKKLNIEYEIYKHHQAHTMDELDEVQKQIGGIYCKNLFLKNSKGDMNYLILVNGDKKVDTKALAKNINSTRLSFNSSEKLMELMQLTPGSVGPFGLLNNEKKDIQILIDEEIVQAKRISFHPNNNAKTIVISYEGLIEYLEYVGNSFNVTNLIVKK